MTQENTYNIIRLFGQDDPQPVFKISRVAHQAPGMAPPELYTLPQYNAQGIANHYGIPAGEWNEPILNLADPSRLLDPRQNLSARHADPTINCDWVTALDVKAFRKGKIKISPLAAGGIVRTSDGYILLPVRGGDLSDPEKVQLFARGYYGLVPGGSIPLKDTYPKNDPIADTLTHEFREEIGPFGCSVEGLVSIIDSIGALPGLKFVASIYTDATLAQVQRANLVSNQLRRSLTAIHAKPADITEELRQRNLPVDAWESDPLLGLPNDRHTIEQFVHAQRHGFIGPSLGGLLTYATTRLLP